jgi:uncharacterized protein
MSIETKTDLLALVAQHQHELQGFGVKRLGVFGSFVRSEQHETSDVDVLVEFEAGHKTFDNFMRLAFYLEELFGRNVDLLTPESLSPHFGPRILREVEYVAFRP